MDIFVCCSACCSVLFACCYACCYLAVRPAVIGEQHGALQRLEFERQNARHFGIFPRNFFSVLFSGAEQQDLLDGPARLSLLPGLLRPAAPVLLACCFLAAVGEQQDANQASASKWKFW